MTPCTGCPRPARCSPMLCEWFHSGDSVRRAHVLALAGRPREPRAFPPLVDQAANLAGAVGRFVASGGELATPGEQARRLAICSTCPEFVDRRCRKCGCTLAYKVRSAAEHCPLPDPRW